MAVSISGVQQGSPAQAAGLAAGALLLSIDGHAICDGLDYEFYSSGASLLLEVEQDGATRQLQVEKDEYQPLGCVFDSYLIDKHRHCRNKCVFCFIDQMPKGMRPSLYFKDDDERLSFLFGNYITLTNLTQREVRRIIEMRFAPVNISVHTANPALRAQMMGNPKAGHALEIIPQLAAAGIEMNFQLVLCPGLNDGDELRRSITWLRGFVPCVGSIAAVPVGLSRHRQGLAPLRRYTREEAATQLDIMLEMGDECAQKSGVRLVYPSDEWFLLAGRQVPSADFYDGYPQLENGVGMWRLLADEFDEALAEVGGAPDKGAVHLATGLLAQPLLAALAGRLMAAVPGIKVQVHGIENHFFGPGVTVSGLLCGQDIVQQLRGKVTGGLLLLPPDVLRAEGDVLLDDMTPQEIGRQLGVQVQVPGKSGRQLLWAMLGRGEED